MLGCLYMNPPAYEPPEEYIELLQCQMYGCTPSELREQNVWTVNRHWLLYNEANRIKNLK